jgi:GNAT superfamily N-acetyltransferase
MIRSIEEHSLNAWPALQTNLQDGWLLRFAAGYTRRANSVNPLYPCLGDPLENISACEALYRARGLPVIFKITPASQPPGLDELLAARGYRLEATTSVQLLPLAQTAHAPLNPVNPLLPVTSEDPVTITPTLVEAWLAAYTRISAAEPAREAIHRQLLQSILAGCAYAALPADGQIVSVGLGILQGGLLGLYDIATHPANRRQGHAARVIHRLLAWGRGSGAAHAYLQVMLNNPPALALYATLGFRELYQYHYRVKA